MNTHRDKYGSSDRYGSAWDTSLQNMEVESAVIAPSSVVIRSPAWSSRFFSLGILLLAPFVLYLSSKSFNQFSPSLKASSELEENAQSALFSSFREAHGRVYSGSEEEAYRFKVFKSNMALADLRNQQEKESGGDAIHGVTMFSDLTPEEFKSRFVGYDPSAWGGVSTSGHSSDLKVEAIQAANVIKDWSSSLITPIKSQDRTKACWAFTATQQIESDAIRASLLTKSQALSPQQIISCNVWADINNPGISSSLAGVSLNGSPQQAVNWLSFYDEGLVLETTYPFQVPPPTSDPTSAVPRAACDTTKTALANEVVKPTGIVLVPPTSTTVASSEAAMAQYLSTTGPLLAAVYSPPLQTYVSGTITASCKNVITNVEAVGADVDHAVQVVGIDTDSATPSYLIRNTWGTSWGNAGFFRIKYGVGMCGIGYSGYSTGFYTTVVAGPATTPVAIGSPWTPTDVTMSFDGTSTKSYTGLAALSDTFTVTAWVTLTTGPSYYTVVEVDGTNKFHLLLQSSGVVSIIDSCVGASVVSLTSTEKVPMNTRTFIAFVKKGKVGRLYINGNSYWINMAALALCTSYGGATSTLVGGSNVFGSMLTFKGVIDNLKIYSGRVSHANVLALYAPSTTAQPIATPSQIPTMLPTAPSATWANDAANGVATLTVTGSPTLPIIGTLSQSILDAIDCSKAFTVFVWFDITSNTDTSKYYGLFRLGNAAATGFYLAMYQSKIWINDACAGNTYDPNSPSLVSGGRYAVSLARSRTTSQVYVLEIASYNFNTNTYDSFYEFTLSKTCFGAQWNVPATCPVNSASPYTNGLTAGGSVDTPKAGTIYSDLNGRIRKVVVKKTIHTGAEMRTQIATF